MKTEKKKILAACFRHPSAARTGRLKNRIAFTRRKWLILVEFGDFLSNLQSKKIFFPIAAFFSRHSNCAPHSSLEEGVASCPTQSHKKNHWAPYPHSRAYQQRTTFFRPNRRRGITLLELLVVLAVLAVLAVIFLPSILGPKQMHRSPRIQCVNNLKQIALATRVWEGDNNDKYPPQVSVTNGGSMEYSTGTNVWRHFQVMSNEISTPKIVICPADENRVLATNFTWFNNTNVSFFYGIDAAETNGQMMLSGDRNITNGAPIKNGVLTLTTNRLSGWTSEMHNKVGNVALADGSVQQISIVGLQTTLRHTGVTTNRLQMPVLSP